MTDGLWQWSAVELARAIRTRQVSSLEATDDCLARIRSVNPSLNAIVDRLDEDCREAARRADAGVARGDRLGPLHGVPVTVKVNVDFRGRPTTNGVKAFQNRMAADDSPAVRRWREAGAIFVGRTNTPAMSFGLFTNNDLYGRTRNPWDFEITPGGSSGGAAVSVAAGMVPLAHGNDSGGSIRYPAYCCGIAGIRPTFGRVASYNGTAASEPPILAQLASVNGALARSIGDLRLGLEAMSGRDRRDPWSIPAPIDRPHSDRPCRVAILAELPGVARDDETVEAVRKAASWLADAGYTLVETAPPRFAEASALRDKLLLHEIRKDALSLIEAHATDQEVNEAHALIKATPEVDFDAFVKGLAERTTHIREWLAFLDEIPLVLTPTTWRRPMSIHAYDHPVELTPAMVLELSPLHVPPLLGLPSLAVPTGTAGGLPMGVQLIGGWFEEERLFAAGEVIEQRCPALTPIDPRLRSGPLS